MLVMDDYLSRILPRFRFVETAELGLFFMVPNAALGKAEAAVFAGAKVPLLLHPVQCEDASRGTYAVISTTYENYFIDGLAMDWKKAGRLQSLR